jgi:hypothetical protein
LTWLSAAAAIIAVGCVLASAQRLVWALCPTRFDLRLLTAALQGDLVASARKLRDALGASARGDWACAVLDALREPSKAARDALLSEQLTEYDGLAQRWSRVPRVCASVSTSAGFLFASIALIKDLSTLDPGSAPASVEAALFSALDSLAVGVAGTSFCAAVHVRARRVARDRFEAAARFVEKVLSLEVSGEPPAA